MRLKANYCRSRGFSLAETLISTAAAGMLLTGISSAIFFSVRASDPDQGTTDTLDAAAVAEDIVADLQCATSFSERTATAVTFTVADRTGDGQPDTLRYAWLGSGTTPGAVVRQLNGGTNQSLLEQVQNFQLDYITQIVNEEIPQTTESTEVELFQNNLGDLEEGYEVTSSRWRCQYFHPAPPSDVLLWRPTRIRFKARRVEEASGTAFRVQLRPAASALFDPGAIVLEEQVIPKASLDSSYNWVNITFSGSFYRSPKEGLCLVVRDDGPTVCELAKKSVAVARTKYSESFNQGATWSGISNRVLIFYIYGTYTTAAPPLIVPHTLLTSVRTSIQTTAGATMHTAAHLFSPVEVSAP